MKCIITYQKSNGEIIIRPSKHDYLKRIGDDTSMGWKILDIHYKYKDNYYCFEDFIKVCEQEIKEERNKKLLKYIIKKLKKYA